MGRSIWNLALSPRRCRPHTRNRRSFDFRRAIRKAAGAIVIATTSSADKAQILKKLGADHVINYKETPDWGEKAAALTDNKEGVTNILEVGGRLR